MHRDSAQLRIGRRPTSLKPKQWKGILTIPVSESTGRFVRWLVASVLGVTVLTIVCVHAPGRIKLLGLFALGYGLLSGVWMSRMVQATGVNNARTATVLGAFLAAAGISGMALESHRLYESRLAREYEVDPNAVLASKTAIAGADDSRTDLESIFEESRQRRLERLAEISSFSAYLTYRTAGGRKQATGWPGPWPWVLFASEVTIASAAAACILFREFSRPRHVIESVDEPDGPAVESV